MTRHITIGTRASPLALAQTEQIVAALQSAGRATCRRHYGLKKFPPKAMRF
jgi:porphobilinogen deaminase